MKGAARAGELLGGVEDDGMPLHHAESRHEPGDGHAFRHSQFGTKSAGAAGPEALPVRPPGQRHHAIRRGEPGPDALAPYRLADRHHEIGGARVQPAIQGMGPNGLHDVARPDERSGRSRSAIGEGGEPVLLAPVDVDDVDGG